MRLDIVKGHCGWDALTLVGVGVHPIVLNDVEALHIGDFLVVALPALEARYPGMDFTRRDAGPHMDVVSHLLHAYRDFRKERGGVMAMLFDERPEGSGHFRLFPRFSETSAACIPYEFQCGTGTVAVAIALARASKQRSSPKGCSRCPIIERSGVQSPAALAPAT